MDFETVRNLIDTLTELANAHNVEEIEVQQADLRVRIRRTAPSAPLMAAALPAAAAPASAAPPAAPVFSEPELFIVHSPIVGTFFESPSPGATEFVRVGDTVETGQVLCIIEAMKLMNEIEAEVAGQIARKFVTNGQPVEFGEALFAIRPAGAGA